MTNPQARRVGILISGRGSNMISLVEGMQQGRVAAFPTLVLSNVPSAVGLERARELGVATAVVPHRRKKREEHEREVVAVLHQHEVEIVCLAGYMRLLSPYMVREFRHRMLNIHPSLLPAFPGLHAQEQALKHGVRVAGCTVHFVDEECDHGPIVLQATVPVHENDDADLLSARILEQEHRIYPRALDLCARGCLKIEGRRVRILEPIAG